MIVDTIDFGADGVEVPDYGAGICSEVCNTCNTRLNKLRPGVADVTMVPRREIRGEQSASFPLRAT